MALLPAQYATLKTFILADPALSQVPLGEDGDDLIARALNVVQTPDFWVFKTSVTNEEIGDAMNGSEVAGLSSLGMQRLQVLAAYSGGAQNPSRADRRAAFDAVFNGAGGAITRPALAVLWRRLATRVERLYATGTGSTGAPGTLVFIGPITRQEVAAARAS